MKLLGIIAFLLLLATLLLPARHQARCHDEAQVRRQAAPVQIIRSPWAARAPKTVRRVRKGVKE